MERAIRVLDRLFAGRRDTYVSYVPGESYSGKRVRENVSDDVWRAHVSGQRPIGVYPLVERDGEWVTSWACIDIDQDRESGRAHEIASAIAHAAETKMPLPLSIHCEITKSKQAHVWFFFDEPVLAWKARAVARAVIKAAGHREYKSKDGGEEIVVCPAHDACPPEDKDGRGGTGMCIYVPWFGTNAKDGRQVFYDWHSGAPHADQVAAMEAAALIKAGDVDTIVDMCDLHPTRVRQIGAPSPASPNFVAKAPAGSLPALADGEFVNLCEKLKALRAMRETPAQCSYGDWFAGIMHLVPFADGRARAHQLSALDKARYDAGVVDRQWTNAVALYSRDDAQPEARASQRIVEFWRGGGRPDITPISASYCIFKGCFARRRYKGQGEDDPSILTNFTANVVCEERVDDGSGNRQRFVRIRGQLTTGQPLPEIAVPTKDWTSIGVWLHDHWGFKPVIYGKDRDALQCIALCGQDAPERTSYTHTGWMRTEDGQHVFLTPTGPRGAPVDQVAFAEAARVSTPHELRNYDVPATCTPDEARDAYLWLERLVLVGDARCTAPVVASLFLAPLASFLNLDFALFLAGGTGSHKTSLVAAALGAWGRRWTKDTPPTTFNSTANSIENTGFQAKDLPLLIDNYVPDARGAAQAQLKRLAHSIGDHAGRGRLDSSARAVAAKPFRSFCIITGEDVPFGAGAGATNRFYVIPMLRSSLRLVELEAIQEAGWAGKMAPAMTHYLSWLADRMTDPDWASKVQAYQYRLEKEARRLAAGKDHDRLTSQTAWIQTGLDLFRSSHPAKAFLHQELASVAGAAIQAALGSRRQMSRESSLTYRFLSSVAYLVQVGEIHGVDARTGSAPADLHIASFLGWTSLERAPFVDLRHPKSRCAIWIDVDMSSGDFVLAVRPDEIVTQIKQSIRMECAIPEGSRGIAQALLSEGLLMPGDEDGHATSKLRLWNKQRERVWKIHGRAAMALLGLHQDESAPPPAADPNTPR